jgi:hypothetical protein
MKDFSVVGGSYSASRTHDYQLSRDTSHAGNTQITK